MSHQRIRQIAYLLATLAWWAGATVRTEAGVVFSNSPSPVVVCSGCYFATDLVVKSVENSLGAFAVRVGCDTDQVQLVQIDVASNSTFSANTFVDPAALTSGVARVVAFQATNSASSREDFVLRVTWKALGDAGQSTDIRIAVEKAIGFWWLPVSASSATATVHILDTAPSLAPTGDCAIDIGTTLTFTNGASDPGVLPQPLKARDQPQFTSLSLKNGQPVLTVTGDIGNGCVVQASTNLVDWVTVFTAQSAVELFSWSDTNAISFPVRYYRIAVGQPVP